MVQGGFKEQCTLLDASRISKPRRQPSVTLCWRDATRGDPEKDLLVLPPLSDS